MTQQFVYWIFFFILNFFFILTILSHSKIIIILFLFSKSFMNQIQNLKSINSIINSVILDVLKQTQLIIKEKQLQTKYPQFTHNYLINIMHQHIYQFTPNYSTLKPSKIQQQTISDIKRIDKDNLTPKQLQNQQTQTVKQLPDMLSQVGSKKLNLTNRSSFLKRKISQISSIPSTNRVEKHIKQSNKKDPLINFKYLAQNQQEDIEIAHLRQKIQFKNKQSQRQKQQKQQKQRLHKEKIQQFHNMFQTTNQNHQLSLQNIEKNDNKKKKYTFDYGGETIEAQNKDQKIVYYSMKIDLRTIGKGFRTVHKRNDYASQTQQLINKNKTRRPKQIDKSRDQLHTTIDIPVFSPDEYRTSIFQTDPAKLKIIEYKKLYGHKFSRYDKNAMTIDVSRNQTKQNEQDYFGQKKHFKDSKNLNKSLSSSRSKYSPRRLALPKLQGKYKVIDHYQEIF